MDNTIGEQIEALRIDCERQEVYYKTMISTHEVTIGQQLTQLQKLEKAVKELKIDSSNRQTAIDIERKATVNKLTKAQEVVSDNVNTILRLQAEVDAMNSLDAIDVENLVSFNIEKELAGGEEHTLTDESLILQYTGVIEAEDNPFPGKTTPVPYPYTHPIREVPEYSKVHIPV